jgi:hypothetical protein
MFILYLYLFVNNSILTFFKLKKSIHAEKYSPLAEIIFNTEQK